MAGLTVDSQAQIPETLHHSLPMGMSDSVGAQVRVRFTTRQPEYHISSSPILVPSNIRRYQLSEIINKILGNDQPVAFEFVLNDRVIRGTLGSHILKYNLNTEAVLEIEYFASGVSFTKETVCEYQDWISALSVSQNDRLVFSSSFGGEICAWDFTGNILARMGTNSQINKIVYLPECEYLIYGTENCDVNLHKYDFEVNQITPILSGKLDAPVTSLREYNKGTMFVTGCSNGNIHLWDMLISRDDLNMSAAHQSPVDATSTQSQSEVSRPTRKKRSDDHCLSTPALKTFSPVTSLPKQHTSTVSCFSVTPNGSFSGGHDHKIIQWDLNKNTWIHSTDTNNSVLCMDANLSLNALITGYTNNSIKIHDIRSSKDTLDLRSIDKLFGKNAHSSWVSQVKWCPSGCASHPYSLASASYDGTIKTWDIRTLSPTHSIRASPPNSKIFALSWTPPSILIAGGQECKLKFFY